MFYLFSFLNENAKASVANSNPSPGPDIVLTMDSMATSLIEKEKMKFKKSSDISKYKNSKKKF